MTTDTKSPAPPIVPYLKRDADGEPYLEGSRCDAGGPRVVGARPGSAQNTREVKT
jgi:hypothetical protein